MGETPSRSHHRPRHSAPRDRFAFGFDADGNLRDVLVPTTHGAHLSIRDPECETALRFFTNAFPRLCEKYPQLLPLLAAHHIYVDPPPPAPSVDLERDFNPEEVLDWRNDSEYFGPDPSAYLTTNWENGSPG
jgi:hypothetical protein